MEVIIRLQDTPRDGLLSIYSSDGKVLRTESITSINTVLKLNSENWPKGVFLGVVSSDKGILLNTKGIKN